MVKRKVAELEGAALDWAVAMATGKEVFIDQGFCALRISDLWVQAFRPSTDWAKGGPLIEQYGLTLIRFDDGLIEAYRNDEAAPQASHSYLVAACRAIVASELGEEVEIPEELANA